MQIRQSLWPVLAVGLLASCGSPEELREFLEKYGKGGGAGGTSGSVIEVGEGESCAGFTPPPQRVCKKGLSCNARPGQCSDIIADAPGICEAVPTACTREYAPVCGCDNKTYGNDCMRKAAGVGVRHPGECGAKPGRKEGEMCGGIAGFVCEAGLHCEHPVNTCNLADGAGVCVKKGDVCTAIYAPVCGCDKKTYSSDCVRRAAGVNKAHDGECKPDVAPARK